MRVDRLRALFGEGGQGEGAVWRGRTGRGRCAIKHKTHAKSFVLFLIFVVAVGAFGFYEKESDTRLSSFLLPFFFGYWPKRCCLRVRLLVYGLISRASISSMLPLRGMITFL